MPGAPTANQPLKIDEWLLAPRSAPQPPTAIQDRCVVWHTRCLHRFSCIGTLAPLSSAREFHCQRRRLRDDPVFISEDRLSPFQVSLCRLLFLLAQISLGDLCACSLRIGLSAISLFGRRCLQRVWTTRYKFYHRQVPHESCSNSIDSQGVHCSNSIGSQVVQIVTPLEIRARKFIVKFHICINFYL